jgi:hypothetical protein
MCAGLNGDRALPKMFGKVFSGVVRRLHTEHEFEVFGADIVPAEPAFRLEKHCRVDNHARGHNPPNRSGVATAFLYKRYL